MCKMNVVQIIILSYVFLVLFLVFMKIVNLSRERLYRPRIIDEYFFEKGRMKEKNKKGNVCDGMSHYSHSSKKLFYRSFEGTEEYLCLYFRNDSKLDIKPLFIINHGFSDDSFSSVEYLEPLINQYNTILYDYPGFGFSSGKTSEIGVLKTLELVVDFCVEELRIKKKDIILYGHSFGSFPTIHVSQVKKNSYEQFGGLVLHSPISTSVRWVYDLLVVESLGIKSNWIRDVTCNFLEQFLENFPNLKNIQNVENNTIIFIHGEREISIRHTKELFAATKNRKEIILKGGDYKIITSEVVEQISSILFPIKLSIEFGLEEEGKEKSLEIDNIELIPPLEEKPKFEEIDFEGKEKSLEIGIIDNDELPPLEEEPKFVMLVKNKDEKKIQEEEEEEDLSKLEDEEKKERRKKRRRRRRNRSRG